MQGTSHVGFALAGAMMINSTVYALHPQPLHNNWEWLLHAIGTPLTYHTLMNFYQHPSQLISTALLLTIVYKFSFYSILCVCIMWPDRWEHKHLADGTTVARFSPHRGPTHSIIMLLLICMLFGLLYDVVIAYLQLYHVSVDILYLREGSAIATGIFLAFVLHILADMFTRDGVKVLWPADADVGIPPIRQWRPLSGSPGEYAWLWAIIFVAGVLFGFGLIGF